MNVRRVAARLGVAAAVIGGLCVAFLGVLAFKVASRPPLEPVESTRHATIARQACVTCHEPIAAEWRQSYHYKSVTGAYWRDVRDLGYLRMFNVARKPCVNCHAPANVLDIPAGDASAGGTLGVECSPNVFRDPPGAFPSVRSDDVELGVDCTACHVSTQGIVGSGRRPAPAHETMADLRFQDGRQTSVALCSTCHRSAVEAWVTTPLAKGGVTCLDCHMPRITAANTAGGPLRQRRSHRFAGDKDSTMLARAIRGTVTAIGDGRLRLSIRNDSTGHHLPSGGNWISARWTARDEAGRVIKDDMTAFGRNETLVLDFWPFNRDTRIPAGGHRDMFFELPKGHGRVEVVIRYHDWIRTSQVVQTLAEAY